MYCRYVSKADTNLSDVCFILSANGCCAILRVFCIVSMPLSLLVVFFVQYLK